MAKRNVPYGYCYINGEIVIEENESIIVKEIFSNYLQGKPLSWIKESLNNRKVEFFKGKCEWDKGNIKRILDDERYIGKNDYPLLIDVDTFNKAQDKVGFTEIHPRQSTPLRQHFMTSKKCKTDSRLFLFPKNLC